MYVNKREIMMQEDIVTFIAEFDQCIHPYYGSRTEERQIHQINKNLIPNFYENSI